MRATFNVSVQNYALFDKAGNQVPQELVTKVEDTFEHILEEICKVRDEQVEDISIAQAFSIVFKRNPELRLEGLAHSGTCAAWKDSLLLMLKPSHSTGLLAAEDCRMRVLERYGEIEHEIEEEAPASVPPFISRIVI